MTENDKPEPSKTTGTPRVPRPCIATITLADLVGKPRSLKDVPPGVWYRLAKVSHREAVRDNEFYLLLPLNPSNGKDRVMSVRLHGPDIVEHSKYLEVCAYTSRLEDEC